MRKILPYCAQKKFKKILFVGVQRYTEKYSRCFSDSQFVTIDVNPKLARFGAKLHICDSILNLARYRESYFPGGLDLILLNGVIGYGLDSSAEIELAFLAMIDQLNSMGQIVIGVNPQFIDEVSLRKIKPVEERLREISFGSAEKRSFRFRQPLQKNAVHEYFFFAHQSPSKHTYHLGEP